MPAKKLKTSNTAQPNVAEKATNVAKKATEQIKKPTIKSLQQEVTNLTEQLIYANKLCVSQELDIVNLKEDNNALEREVNILNASVRYRDELIDRLETPWWKRALNLFGN